ncbi:MAG: Dyp-type peroxidase [Rhodospirillales bacterium]|nr:Dyp-type peroxidase [Rhodospirillales bacterium]
MTTPQNTPQATPQAGIFIEGNRAQHVLEYTLKADAPMADVKSALARARADVPAGIAQVLAVGPGLWARLARNHMPLGLTDFQPITGPKAHAPASQRDVLVWLHGPARDAVFDAAKAVDHALQGVAVRELDLPGFTYRDSRDMTGFIDGSANPKDVAARKVAALVPDGEAGAGGAFVLSQRYIHNLDAFNALSEAAQERVIGRTKADSIELAGDAQPADSHVSRTDLKIDGVGQKMYRRSMPYGTAGEHGLYFLAFACAQSRFEVVLNSMYGLTGDGITDHLMDFSQAVTGSYWFAPSEGDLEKALG